MHHGKQRGIDSTELSFKLCCARDENAEWNTQREHVTGLAVIHLEKQLIGITSERISKTKISKTYGKAQGCKLWLYMCLPILVVVLLIALPMLFVLGIGIVFFCICFVLVMCCVGLFKIFFAPTTTAFSAKADDDNEELEQLIVEETDYRNTFHGGDLTPKSQEEWEAKLFQSNYRALAICVLDPYHDQAREIIAVIKPDVRESEVVRFVMLADASKATKPSKDLESIRFVGNGRNLRKAARFAEPSAAKFIGDIFKESNGSSLGGGNKSKIAAAACCVCCVLPLLIVTFQ